MADKERFVCDLCRISWSISAVFSCFVFVLSCVFFLELLIVLYVISTKKAARAGSLINQTLIILQKQSDSKNIPC